MSIIKPVAVTLISVLSTGCASIYTMATVEGPPVPYSGVRLDASVVATRVKDDTGLCRIRYCESLWWFYYPAAVADISLSAIVDTVLLPYTLTNNPAVSSREDR